MNSYSFALMRATFACLVISSTLTRGAGPQPSWLSRLPDQAHGGIEVSDYDAAKQWRVKHGGDGDAALRRDFRLPELPLGISSAARISLATNDQSEAEAFVFRTKSKAVSQQLYKRFAGKSSPTDQVQVLSRLEKTSKSPGLVCANRGNSFAFAPTDRFAIALLQQESPTTLGSTATQSLSDLKIHPMAPIETPVVRVNSFLSFQQMGIDTKSARDRKRHGADSMLSLAANAQLSDKGESQTVALLKTSRPPTSTAGIFVLRNEPEISCPAWMSAASNHMTIVQVDLSQSMRNFGALFDDLYARGIKGTYDEILSDVKSPDGLGIDIESILFDRLGKACVFGQIKSNHSGDDNSYVALAIQTGHQDNAANVIKQLIADDPGLRTSTSDGMQYPLWSFVPEESSGSKEQTKTGVTILGQWMIYANDDRVIQSLQKRYRASSSDHKVERYQLPLQDGKHLDIGAMTLIDSSDSQAAISSPLNPFFDGQTIESLRLNRSESPLNLVSDLASRFGLASGQTWARSEPSGWFFFSTNDVRKQTYHPAAKGE